MQLPLIVCGLLASLAAHVSATALTYKLQPNEGACFYTAATKPNEKIAFYFAVRFIPLLPYPLSSPPSCASVWRETDNESTH